MRRDCVPEVALRARAATIPRSAIVFAHDTAVAGLSFFLAFMLDNGMELSSSGTSALLYGTALFTLIAGLSFYAFNLHRGAWSYTSVADLTAIAATATGAICLFLLALLLVDRAAGVPRSVLVIQWFILIVLLSASRLGYRFVKMRALQGRAPARFTPDAPVLLYGCGPMASLFVRAAQSMPGAGVRVVGIVDDVGDHHGRRVNGVPVLGHARDLGRILAHLALHGVHPRRLVVARAADELPEAAQADLEAAGARHALEVEYLPAPFGLRDGAAPAAPTARDEPTRLYLRLRYVAEVALSAAALLVLLPLMAAVAALVLLDSGRPVLFRQVRPGRHMRPFTLYKFRTMRTAFAADGTPLADDSRTSAIGRFLRRTRLDELPQLYNILVGDMAFIGPRPLLYNILVGDMAFIGPRPLLPRDLPKHLTERVAVRPGITGWAQVNGGDLLTTAEKTALDAWYIRHANPIIDARIVFRTLRMVIVGDRINHAEILRATATPEPVRARAWWAPAATNHNPPPPIVNRSVHPGPSATALPPPAHALPDAAQATAVCKVTIINQYFVPDVASTGQLLHSLAVGLRAHSIEVDVLTAKPSYGPPETRVDCPAWEEMAGARIRRVWTARFGKDHMVGRLLNVATFLLQVTVRMLVGRRDRVYVYVTNPPFLGWIGGFVSLIRPHRFVLLVHDAYPQVAVWAGAIAKNGFVERVWHAINRLSYRRAAGIVVLCRAAKTLLCEEYGLAPERVNVVHNWADGDSLMPKPKAVSAFARTHGLVEPFTVLYSGNLGLCYDFETILEAAARLKDASFRLVLVGSGGKRAWLQQEIEGRGLINTLLLPYQPLERLNDSLNACDASLVTIAPGIEGMSFPSKLYSSLAVGKPVLALCPPDSELRAIVEEHDAGVWAPVGDGEAAEAAIRWLMAHPDRAREQGANARKVFEAKFTRNCAAANYLEVLRTAAARRPIDLSGLKEKAFRASWASTLAVPMWRASLMRRASDRRGKWSPRP